MTAPPYPAYDDVLVGRISVVPSGINEVCHDVKRGF